MARLSVNHSTFAIERMLSGRPRHAFRFWSDVDLKRRWTSCHPDWRVIEQGFDFRVGGTEVNRLKTPAGVLHDFHAYYLDIVQGARIVYAYDMSVDGRRISASLATVELVPSGSNTTMIFTEQIAVLDGQADVKGRTEGTEMGFERLALELERELSTLQ